MYGLLGRADVIGTNMREEPACLGCSTCVPNYMASQSQYENMKSSLPLIKLVEIMLWYLITLQLPS